MAPLRWNEPIWNRTQVVLCWTVGLGAAISELFIRSEPRPLAYPLIFGLLAFPATRALDKWRRARDAARGELEK